MRARLEGVLDIKNKGFITGMNAAALHAKTKGKEMEGAFAGIGAKLGAVFTAGAVMQGLRHIGNFASEIHDLADTTGMTTDAFQQFSFAVSQSGGSQEVFVKAMLALTKAMEDAKNGTGTATDSFAALGISLSDIARSSPDKILLMIADAMKKSGGSGGDFAAVADLIGIKVATKMVPSLKMGSEGFLDLANSASIASKEAIDAAENMQDKYDAVLKRMETSTTNTIAKIGVGWSAFISFFKKQMEGAWGAKASENWEKTLEEQAKQFYGEQPSGMAHPKDSGAMGPPMISDRDLQKNLAADAARKGKDEADAAKRKQAADEANLRTRQEIFDTYDETQSLELETMRSQMTDQQLYNSLLDERIVKLKAALDLEKAGGLENVKSAAALRKEVAELDQKMSKIPERKTATAIGFNPNKETNRTFSRTREMRKTAKEAERAAEEEQRAKDEAAGINPNEGPPRGRAREGAYNQIRRGDTAKAAAREAERNKKESDPVVGAIKELKGVVNKPDWVKEAG